jgi:uncharacterized protein (DUF111 family)
MDILGFFLCLNLLKVEEVRASPLKLGWGSVDTEHGTLPVPVPAVTHLIKGIPAVGGPVEGELTTPTGALLITAVAKSYGPLQSMKIISTGTGSGARDSSPGHWNVTRVILGEKIAPDTDHNPSQTAPEIRERTMLEFNMDDISGEQLAWLQAKLLSGGAFDVSLLTGIGKKAGRWSLFPY